VYQWLLPLDSGVRSGHKLFFLSVLKAEAGLGEEAAVGEDTEDVEHPEENAYATADHKRERAAFPWREGEEGLVDAANERVWAVTVNPHAMMAAEFRRIRNI